MHLRYEAVSICFAEFQNPTWNCRGICPLGWQSSMHHWRFVVKTGGSFAFFTLLHGRTLPSAFAPIEWKASVVTHPPTLSIFFHPTHPLSPPLPFLSLLEQPIHRMPILNLLPYAIFTREFVLVLADLLTVARSSFLNFGINLVFFSFMIWFNVIMYNIFRNFKSRRRFSGLHRII